MGEPDTFENVSSFDYDTCDWYLGVRTKKCSNPSGECAYVGIPLCAEHGGPPPVDEHSNDIVEEL